MQAWGFKTAAHKPIGDVYTLHIQHQNTVNIFIKLQRLKALEGTKLYCFLQRNPLKFTLPLLQFSCDFPHFYVEKLFWGCSVCAVLICIQLGFVTCSVGQRRRRMYCINCLLDCWSGPNNNTDWQWWRGKSFCAMCGTFTGSRIPTHYNLQLLNLCML